MITNQSNECVQHYEEKSQIFQSVHFKELISTINIKKGCKILDVGCGTGNHSAILADMVGPNGKVVAIDPINERIECAKKLYQRNNLEYHVDSAMDVCNYGNDFDLIVACHVIHWIHPKDKQKTFQVLYNALADGGVFVFVTGHEDHGTTGDLFKTLRLLGEIGKEMSSQIFLETGDTLRQLAKQAGFRDVLVMEKIIEIPVESLEKAFEYYASSFHTKYYHEIMTAFRTRSKHEDISFLYNKHGIVVSRTHLNFFKCMK